MIRYTRNQKRERELRDVRAGLSELKLTVKYLADSNAKHQHNAQGTTTVNGEEAAIDDGAIHHNSMTYYVRDLDVRIAHVELALKAVKTLNIFDRVDMLEGDVSGAQALVDRLEWAEDRIEKLTIDAIKREHGDEEPWEPEYVEDAEPYHYSDEYARSLEGSVELQARSMPEPEKWHTVSGVGVGREHNVHFSPSAISGKGARNIDINLYPLEEVKQEQVLNLSVLEGTTVKFSVKKK